MTATAIERLALSRDATARTPADWLVYQALGAEPELKRWNEAKLGPRPSEQELSAAIEEVALIEAAAAKTAELRAAFAGIKDQLPVGMRKKLYALGFQSAFNAADFECLFALLEDFEPADDDEAAVKIAALALKP